MTGYRRNEQDVEEMKTLREENKTLRKGLLEQTQRVLDLELQLARLVTEPARPGIEDVD